MNTNQNNLEELKSQALDLMERAGYGIVEDVSVIVDEQLPYMGYTTERGDKTVVVVSGDALKSGMALNLLIHELSHVYRTQSRHPSHNYGFLTTILTWMMRGKVVEDYQEKIVHSIINHIQDLYADDISFAIFKKSLSPENLSEFFLNWVHEPVTKKSEEQSWMNADSLLSAAFAQANLERHKVEDVDGKVEKAVADFLSKIDKKQAEKYAFFKEFMVNLPEEVAQKEFEKLLIQYLSEFLKLTTV
jgi:hypothetical protein